MNDPFVLTDTDRVVGDRNLVGGKAYMLGKLTGHDFRVPRFYVVTTKAFQSVVDDSDHRTAEQLREHLRQCEIPRPLLDAVRSAHASVLSPDCRFAVRSSAASEDGQHFSFAGMYESVLGATDFDGLVDAVRRVWASAFSPAVAAYRQTHGLSAQPSDAMAVVVQEMIDARVSGVCFTSDPIAGDDRVIINSVFGLGEGLVSRGFAADGYRIDRTTMTIERSITRKTKKLIFDSGTICPKCVDVPPPDQERSTLAKDELLEVAQTALRIESIENHPQDVEFCVDESGSLYVLQSRPITGPRVDGDASIPTPLDGNPIIWDNSNIIESYSGVTTPMTFSFIRRAYSIVYHCFAEVMGISTTVVRENRETFENMLGLFRGRVYYNLMNWYRLVSLFPGYSYNREFMESMMGVRESVRLEAASQRIGFWRRWFVEFPAVLRLIARSGWNFARIETIVARFQREFDRDHDEWAAIDFDHLPAHEIARLYDMMERKMLWNWKAPIINDFYVMVHYGLLRKLCVKWCDDETASLQNGLVCGEGGLQSDEPAKLLIEMTRVVRDDPDLCDLVTGARLDSLPERVRRDARFTEFNRLMEEFLDRFGLRCADELKLESLSYVDQPERVYQLIRAHLSAGRQTRGNRERLRQQERTKRAEAEAAADEKISQLRFAWLRRIVFRRVLANTRSGVRHRENMRLARMRIYGILRRMLRSVGKQFAEQGVLQHRDDVFFLTLDEVWSFVRGTAVSADLKGLARFRKSEYARFQSADCPAPGPRFETIGLPYLSLPAEDRVSETDADSADFLQGTGCCPGVVTGVVQVVENPNDETAFTGDILVARRTDPGWVPLFPAFSGILIERGSVLSHSAIVAREMGIATIVGVDGLTRRVATGDRIMMDGRTGTIQLLRGAPVQ